MVDRLPPPSRTPAMPAMNGFTFHIRVFRMLCMHNDKFLPVRTSVAVTSINNNQQSVKTNRRPYCGLRRQRKNTRIGWTPGKVIMGGIG